MNFKHVTPEVSKEEIQEATKTNGPRQLAPKGTYEVRLHSMRGKKINSASGELVSIFFINTEGNYKGAELTLFRVGGNQATTTNRKSVVAIGLAAGLSGAEIENLNWAVDDSEDADERGNLPAAFTTGDNQIVDVEGLRFEAYIDVEPAGVSKSGREYAAKNVIVSLKALG